MSSNKRPADTYLTKEPERNRPAEDIDDDRDVIDPVQLASDEVMATRKYRPNTRSLISSTLVLFSLVTVNLSVGLRSRDAVGFLRPAQSRILGMETYVIAFSSPRGDRD